MIHDRRLKYALLDKGFRYNPETDIWTWHIDKNIKMVTKDANNFDVVTKVIPEEGHNVLDNLEEIADYVRNVEDCNHYQQTTDTILGRIFKQ